MLASIAVVLCILWLMGVVTIEGFHVPQIELFTINKHPVTLWNLFTLFLISWAVKLLPFPLRQIVSILLILWILSITGIIAAAGLSHVLILVVIVGIILSFLKLI